MRQYLVPSVMRLVQKIMAQSDTDRPDWGHIHMKKSILTWTWAGNWDTLCSASIQGPTDRQTEKGLGGVEWEKHLKAFQLKSTWMIKWSSFDVAELKDAHIVSVIDRRTHREMSRETKTIAYRWKQHWFTCSMSVNEVLLFRCHNKSLGFFANWNTYLTKIIFWPFCTVQKEEAVLNVVHVTCRCTVVSPRFSIFIWHISNSHNGAGVLGIK